jgi:hypothetical protein
MITDMLLFAMLIALVEFFVYAVALGRPEHNAMKGHLF